LSSPIIAAAIIIGRCRHLLILNKRFHTDANLATIRDGGRGDGLDRIPPTLPAAALAFSASDPETSAALRQKIESKMKTAGVLGGFLTGLFTFAAKDIGAALMTVNGARPPLHSIAKASCVSGGAAGGLPI
jgi:hypothetical protein